MVNYNREDVDKYSEIMNEVPEWNASDVTNGSRQ